MTETKPVMLHSRTTNGTFQRVTYRVDSGIYYVQQLLLTKEQNLFSLHAKIPSLRIHKSHLLKTLINFTSPQYKN